MHPLVTRQHQQLWILVERFGGDGDVGLAFQRQLGDLCGMPLVQRQANPGMPVDKVLDHCRQRIARLRMGSGDDQAAGVAASVLFADAPDVLGIAQNAFGNFEHRPAGLGDRRQAFAAALEDGHPEFVFEQPDLLGDPRLRGIKRLRGFGDIETTARHFDEIAELLEFHGCRTIGLVITI